MSFRKRTFIWILLVRLLMWSAISYGCDLSAEKQFGYKTFCSSSNSMDFNNAIGTCSSGYVLASIENFVDYTDTMRAIQHFFEDDERVYVSLQNPNRQTCESDKQDKCNNRLQDANSNNLPSLDHVADLNGEDEMCMLYDTDEEYFTGANCSDQAKVLCQKHIGPSDCESDQSYYNLGAFAQHSQARSKCQALGLNLATPLSIQDLEKLEEINDDEKEYWTEIRNFGGVACVDDDCDNKELTTADNQIISLTPFGDITISSHMQCVVGKDETIKSKECDHNKKVICQSSCTWFQTTSSISTSPNTPTEVDVPPSTSSPFTCQPMMSILSPINSKFYKAVNQSTEFPDANQICVESEMELASIQSDEDLQSVLETLGSGSFWVSLYNPKLVSCDSSLTCSIKLRDSFGQIFHSMGLSAEFQITPKRCIRLSINATFTRFESEDCDANYPSACESTCGLGTPAIGVNRCHVPFMVPFSTAQESFPMSFEFGSVVPLM